MTAFSSDEQSRFLENCNTSSIYHDLFVFDFNTGMRLGEILALTWSDYNEDDKTIRVNKNLSIVHDYSSAEKKTKTIIDTTKTKSSERIIPLNKKAIEVINRQREKGKNSIFIFSSAADTPLMSRNVRRSFEALKEKAHIESDVTIHSIRHSFATRLIEKGADIKTVSELLGHKSVKITLDIYTHITGDQKAKAIKLLK